MNDPKTSSREPVQQPDNSDPAETGLAALAWAARGRHTDRIMQAIELRGRRRRRRRIALSTATALLAGIGFWLSPLANPLANQGPEALARLASPQLRTLPDGSVVDLRPGARIEVEYTAALRRVTLHAGEAHFQVRKDAARPFLVMAADVEVRAVGTAFNVDLAARVVNVLVTEGLVSVTNRTPDPTGPTVLPPSIFVAAGQRTSLPRNLVTPPVVSPVSAEEQESRLAWRAPMLEFSGTTLAEAIPMFHREGGERLILDPELGPLRLSGKLRANDTGTLLILLHNEFDIVAKPDGHGNIRLSRP